MMIEAVKEKMSKIAEQQIPHQYSFMLFVVSEGENSARAHENLKRLCEKWLPGRYHIKVVDVVEEFQTALDFNILLTPTVIVVEPKPKVVIYGDLSDSNKFLSALNLKVKEGDD